MTQQVQGVVKRITKNKAYSVLLSDEVWYGAGFDKPSFNEGDTIKFLVQENGKFKNIQKGSVEVVEQQTAKPSEKAASKSNKGSVYAAGTSVRDDYWQSKAKQDVRTQREIRLQASRNAAINMVGLLISHGGLKLPAQVAKIGVVIEDAVEHYTTQFYDATVAIGPLDPNAKPVKQTKPLGKLEVEENSEDETSYE